MQTWKIKRREISRPGDKRWRVRVMGIVMILLTLATAAYDFPQFWNQGAGYVQAQTGWTPPLLSETAFKFGLDLQVGTHLVYEADMKDIAEADRLDALAGVRDVIERRVNAFGVSEPVVQISTTGGTYRVIIELAGVLDVKEAIKQIGETPVLEFKEPGQQLDRELTAEEKVTLEQKQKEDRKNAADVLAKARAGQDFETLYNQYSQMSNVNGLNLGDQAEGVSIQAQPESPLRVDSITSTSLFYGPIGQEIVNSNARTGQIINKVIETSQGLNIVKYIEARTDKEMLLSHILICFEGKAGCQNPIPALDASLQINDIRDQATAENFAELAKQYSTDKSGDGSGDLGWVKPGDVVPAFEIAAKQTAVGAISNVVETDYGYHIILKREEKPITTYSVDRILMPLTTQFDILPPSSPWKNTGLSGKQLKRSTVQFDQSSGAPHISLQFNDEGATLFGELTKANVGQPIAIFLDGAAISTPVVQEAIYGGQAVITGNFTLDEAKLLAQRLNAGALPVPVKLLSQQTVGPTLGAVSLQKSIMAGLIGFALVALYMIFFYRLAGLISVIAIFLYAFLNLAAYRFFGVTITLAGIAGFVLSLGMAVDANVLIIERFKEEYKAGRDFATAIDEGFRRAWSAIWDGNLTTLIAAAVLFYFSSSFIKGFAVTLSIGVLLSMLSAIFVSRVYFKNILSWSWLRHPSLYRAKRPITEVK